MTNHTFTMTEDKAIMVHKVVASHCNALKNCIASAVESGKMERAQELCKELRDYQTLFAAFNMPAKHDIAEGSRKPLETNHTVKEGRFF